MADLRNFMNRKAGVAAGNSRRQDAQNFKVQPPTTRLGRHGPSTLRQENGDIFKAEDLSSHYGASTNNLTRTSQAQIYVGGRGARMDAYGVASQQENSGTLFGTEVGSDFDGSSLSEVAASNGQRDSGNGEIQGTRGDTPHSSSAHDDDEQFSGSDDDNVDGNYPRDTEPTLTLQEKVSQKRDILKVPVRTKSVGQSQSQDRGRPPPANPRPGYDPGQGNQRYSYPADQNSEPDYVDTQYTDIGAGGSQSISQRQTPFPNQHSPGIQLAKNHYMDVSEDDAEAEVDAPVGASIRRPPTMPDANKSKQPHPSSLDYTPDALLKMAYSELAMEPFDTNPSAPAFSNTHADLLPERLASLSTLPMSTEVERSSAQDEQRAFFASLSINEWEDCGDWFVDRFSGIVKKMKVARQEKRKVELAFEQEIADRGERVRVKTEKLKEVMGKMQRDGSVLVQEKIE